MNEKVTKIALASRLIVFCLHLLSNIIVPDHNPDVFKSPKSLDTDENILDKFIHFFFGGFRRWDAEYFLHIAEYGYSYENTLAFYPLFPAIIRFAAQILSFVTFYPTFRYIALVVAVLLNMYFFHRAANALYELTQRMFGDANKSWNAAVVFCFNPASIFFSAPYSEGLFCWLTFSLMLECVTNVSFIKTATTLALSIVCRSNGLMNLGYPVYFIFRNILVKRTYSHILKLLAIIIVGLIPLTIYNFYAFQLFCTDDSNEKITHKPEVLAYGREQNYVIAGKRVLDNSPWCDNSFPFPYSYIQSHYWNVGLFKYYELKQIPNFILATPVLGFCIIQACKYLGTIFNYTKHHGLLLTINNWKSFPFVVHALFLTVFSIFYVHIQVSTRLIASSTPCLYWWAAELLPKTFDRIRMKSIPSLVLYWFGGYFILGTILFSNFLPWT